jgi:cell division protein FtsI (penicillin-binding protein 3)
MKKLVYCFGLIFFVACRNNNPTSISPSIQQELLEKAYWDSSIKVEGYSMQNFILPNIQQVAKDALKESLIYNKADYGYVLVMETKSGKINAVVKLEKNTDGHYIDAKRWMLSEPIEPGGLIKTFDVLSLLEDRKADSGTIYDANGGERLFYGTKITDSRLGFHQLSLANGLVQASNTVLAQAIDSAYCENPVQFTNKLSTLFCVTNQTSAVPKSKLPNNVPNPKSEAWTKASLAKMACGYGLSVSPIQILTFYNAIANNGKMVEPLFISKITNHFSEATVYNTTVIKDSICSSKTIGILQDLLGKVVSQGTGHNLMSDKIDISGKSATIKINSDSNNHYAAAFVGYFPSKNPQYTVLVYVNKPKVNFYGSSVAGTVLKKIAAKILLHD